MSGVTVADLDAWAADREPVEVVPDQADAGESLTFVLQQWGEERARVEHLEAENHQLRSDRNNAWKTMQAISNASYSHVHRAQKAELALEVQRAFTDQAFNRIGELSVRLEKQAARIAQLTAPRPWWKRAVS